MKTNFAKSLIGMAAALLLLAMSSVQVKSQIFTVGDKFLNLGLGFGTHWGYGKTVIPPVSISLDYGFKDDIGPGVLGIGGYAGITSSKYDWWTTNWGWRYTNIFAGARGTYHMEFIEELDTYGGILFGLRFTSSKEYGDWIGDIPDSDAGINLDVGFFAGGRYFFTDNIAGFIELGYGIAYFTLGATLKLQ